MRPERIEELLRTKPVDEPNRAARPILDVVATRAVRSAKVRPAAIAGGLAWTTVVIVAAVAVMIGAIVLRAGPAGPSPLPTGTEAAPSVAFGVIPWIDASPAPSPTPEPTPDAATLPACAVEGLALVAGGWEGATGSMAGGADLINVSPNPCRLWSPAGAQLADATGTVIARLDPAIAAGGSGAGFVGISPGGDVTGTLVWTNWCGEAPKLPLMLTVYFTDGPEETVSIDSSSLTAVVDSSKGGSGVPRCDEPGAGSGVGSISFSAPEPSSGGYQPEPCTAASLVAFSGGWGAAAGSSYAQLVVLNVGGVDCVLPASPVLELRDAHGGLLASAAGEPTAAVDLPANRTALAMMGFSDWCTAPPPMPLTLDLVLGSQSTLQVGHPETDTAAIPLPSCGSAPASSPPNFFYNDAFTVTGMAPPPDPDPGDLLPLMVSISALPTTAPGSVLTYTVTLTNVDSYGKPANLALLCPSYVQRLDLPGADTQLETTHALNCVPAGVLAGGASATFEMHLAIPSTATAGTAGIVWQLGQRGPAAKAVFQIQP